MQNLKLMQKLKLNQQMVKKKLVNFYQKFVIYFCFQILSQKLEWKAESKIGSLSNVNHKPAGGDVKVRI